MTRPTLRRSNRSRRCLAFCGKISFSIFALYLSLGGSPFYLPSISTFMSQKTHSTHTVTQTLTPFVRATNDWIFITLLKIKTVAKRICGSERIVYNSHADAVCWPYRGYSHKFNIVLCFKKCRFPTLPMVLPAPLVEGLMQPGPTLQF